jgi:protease I
MSLTERKLRERRVAVLAADGFEKFELTIPVRAMKLAGAKVDVVSLRHGKIRGINLHEPAGKVRVQKTISEANPENYDALFIPGGFINPDLLRQSAEARNFALHFVESNKPIASLCHGPWVLASTESLMGRTLTSWPGLRDDLVNAGAVWVDRPVVRDGNLLTSRGPQDIVPFVRELLNFFSKNSSLDIHSVQQMSVDPKPNRPPQIVLTAMKWIPRPSFRTLGLLGLVGAFLFFASKKTRDSSIRRRASKIAA